MAGCPRPQNCATYSRAVPDTFWESMRRVSRNTQVCTEAVCQARFAGRSIVASGRMR